MAAKATGITPLQMFESVVIRLYDGGVLSPAVLERVIGAFAQAKVDWHDTVEGRAVDGRSLHDIVALTMLPGQPVESASASFMTVIEHIAGGASETSEEGARPKPARRKKAAPPLEDREAESEPESQELLAQLSGDGRSGKRRRATRQDAPASPRSYNPFVNAQPPRSKKP